MAAGLGYYLSMKINPQLVQQNKMIYEDELKRALDEDGQRTSTFITPQSFYPTGVIMAKYATGKRSKAISDRSGMEYPYREMVKEWNGSLVHYTEFEPKQPQIRRRRTTADAIALTKSKSNEISTTNSTIFKRW